MPIVILHIFFTSWYQMYDWAPNTGKVVVGFVRSDLSGSSVSGVFGRLRNMWKVVEFEAGFSPLSSLSWAAADTFLRDLGRFAWLWVSWGADWTYGVREVEKVEGDHSRIGGEIDCIAMHCGSIQAKITSISISEEDEIDLWKKVGFFHGKNWTGVIFPQELHFTYLT